MFRIEKKTKIRQLTAVVKGLRIYNWDCGRGGIGESKIVTLTINDAKIGYLIFVAFNSGVDHLPSILNSAADATNSNLRKLLQHTKDKGTN